ncbi:deoxyribose-phosphate aldolase [Synechocystis sp. LKSZ1]|uniref:deoxyribose-phosphate aldolase n=1 Tax=Synechocystis sp. LKSZ1 TaxID=3144951 RepID=UPI00336BFADC
MTDLARSLDLAPYIDHALLDPTATPEDLNRACDQAEHHRFAAICVYPSAVPQAVERLRGKKVAVCAVIGFPSGASTSASKLYEAQEATEAGATELDVVINQGWLKAGLTNEVYQDLAQICEATGQKVKAILEMSRLTEAEKRLAADICLDAGASYLKTSTGWFGGATVADVQFLARLIQVRVGIKASGGIRTLEQAIALIEAGATRLGTSHGVDLLQQQRALE